MIPHCPCLHIVEWFFDVLVNVLHGFNHLKLIDPEKIAPGIVEANKLWWGDNFVQTVREEFILTKCHSYPSKGFTLEHLQIRELKAFLRKFLEPLFWKGLIDKCHRLLAVEELLHERPEVLNRLAIEVAVLEKAELKETVDDQYQVLSITSNGLSCSFLNALTWNGGILKQPLLICIIRTSTIVAIVLTTCQSLSSRECWPPRNIGWFRWLVGASVVRWGWWLQIRAICYN